MTRCTRWSNTKATGEADHVDGIPASPEDDGAICWQWRRRRAVRPIRFYDQAVEIAVSIAPAVDLAGPAIDLRIGYKLRRAPHRTDGTPGLVTPMGANGTGR